MLYPVKLYFKNKVTAILLVSSLVLNFAIWGWLLWQLTPTGNPVFLHYNILFGVDSIGDWSQIFYVPLFGLVIIFFNTNLSWFFFQKDKYIGHFFNIVSLFVQFFLLISAVILVALNV